MAETRALLHLVTLPHLTHVDGHQSSSRQGMEQPFFPISTAVKLIKTTSIENYRFQAVKISLDVKKWLVDNDKLDISQEELEQVLFNKMRIKGYGDEYIQRFRMVNQFQQQKRPLIILLCGSACTGKSTLAQHLASRLNLPNVLQTDALRCLLTGHNAAPLSRIDSLWNQKDDASLIKVFQEECHVMRRALDGDLEKVKNVATLLVLLDLSLYRKQVP